VTCNLGTLTSGTVVTAIFPVRVSLTPSETLTNTATVTSYVPDPTPEDNSDEESTGVGTDLAVGKADAQDPVRPGERLDYTLTITKHNPVDVIAARLSDTVANPFNIAIPAPLPTATPYPSTISVSGLAGTVTKATVTLHNATHQYPDQLDLLLVSPGGGSVILMSDAGYFYYGLYSTTVTFDDDAPGYVPESLQQIQPGDYKPTNYGGGADSFPSPAPAGPYGATLSVLNGIRPNGDWSLYVVDDEPASYDGIIAGGWSLSLWTGSSGTVTDVLPSGVTFVSASPGCNEISGTVTCDLGVLADQVTTAFTIAVNAPSTVGPITNSVTVAGSSPDLNPANNSAT
jgi:subtilisin-like proprotein convertase family protein